MTFSDDTLIGLWIHYGPSLLAGLVFTLQLLVASTAIALGLGLTGAVLALWGPRPVRVIVLAYVQIIRSTPAVVIIFIAYYGLPELGIILPQFIAASLAIAFVEGAYFIEIFRGGLIAVDRGQSEAAAALGLKRLPTLRWVVLPQAIPIMLPPAVNQITDVFKTTSLVVVIGAADLMEQTYNAVSESYRAAELYLLAGVLYLAIALPMMWSISRFERLAARYRSAEAA